MSAKPGLRRSSQPHGADIYDAQGRPRSLLDFSSTVLSQGPPRGWKRQATAAVEGLVRYPQPHGRGLDSFLARSLGLKAASVLVSNGASEALDWCARLAAGRRARLVSPCFGDYRGKLERAGAVVDECRWPASQALDLGALARGLKRDDQIWLANPSNPLGQVLGSADLAALKKLCRSRGILLVLDEALLAQRLQGPAPEEGLAVIKTQPSLVVIRSLGKGLGLPGLRLGYLAAEPALAARLRRFQDPWSVNTLAQSLGSWAFTQERDAGPVRRMELGRRHRDLVQRLAAGGAEMGVLGPQGSGYFCVDLGAPVASRVAQRLAAVGFLVRDCSSYGAWGRSVLRLNPRRPAENRALAQAFFKARAKA